MADGKIRGAFNDEQFEAFCAELIALPKKERTLEGIAAFFTRRTGIDASHEAARTFVKGPLARWVEKAQSGRKLGEALKEATGAGVHPLDTIEEIAVIELQDHLTNAEGGKVDVDWLAKQLLKLRTSISLREDARRKQADLERRIADSEARRKNDAARISVLEQRLELAQFEAADAVIEHAKEIKLAVADKTLDGPSRREAVRKILFGERPADFRPVGEKGEQPE